MRNIAERITNFKEDEFREYEYQIPRTIDSMKKNQTVVPRGNVRFRAGKIHGVNDRSKYRKKVLQHTPSCLLK